MRSAFIDELVSAAAVHDNIALIIGDLGFGVVEPFATRFPHRFFNAGVAEQSMMGMAAGLASEGFHVFVYSIANFSTMRCAEQIRNDVDYHNLPVTIVAVGGGVAYGNLGYSHHAVQDYALLRTMPNMLIAAPGDPMEVRACMRYLLDNPQPSYLRLGKTGEPCLHSDVPLVRPGQWLKVRGSPETTKTYLTTGAPLDLTSRMINSKPEMQDWALHSMPLWGMQAKALQTEQIRKYTRVITVEDHLTDAGFGSWFLEAVSSEPQLLSRVRIKALDASVCGMVGKQSTLHAACGLQEDGLCE